jgi:hypothetical protein
MKTAVCLLLGALLISLASCASPQRGMAYGREQEIRRQLGESRPVRDYGYIIKDMRFSTDYKKALVVFTHPEPKTETPDNTSRRPDWEFVLTMDEFGRYRGSNVQPFYTPGTANTPSVSITVTFPAQ